MNTRREFLGLLASASGAFLLPPELRAAVEEGVKLRIGALSDLHLDFGHSYGEYWKLERALAYFRDQNVDAVAVSGDIANNGLVSEFEAFAKMWYGFFPGDRRRDGGKVERVFVFGNHDWSGTKRGKAIYGETPYVDQVLANDPKKCWDACFHEEWKPIFKKEVKGFPFVGAHWSKGGDCNGRCESFVAGLGDFYQSIKGELDAARPFFHVQHPHPRGTVHGTGVWGQDDGESTKVLSAYPNAVAIGARNASEDE